MAKIIIKPIFIAAAIFIIALFLPGYAKFMELRAKNIEMEREIARLERENIRLYKEKKRLEEDMDYVEKVARDSFGLTKKGEIPVRIER